MCVTSSATANEARNRHGEEPGAGVAFRGRAGCLLALLYFGFYFAEKLIDIGLRVRIYFRIEIADVGAHGVFRHDKRCCNLIKRLFARKVLENLRLLGREIVSFRNDPAGFGIQFVLASFGRKLDAASPYFAC